ncbi:MAG: hypothetical protein H7A51_01740 [Akkermansiaceae bacterium]|nr:hypothetical protein [Akkermansiaceae bacterium]
MRFLNNEGQKAYRNWVIEVKNGHRTRTEPPLKLLYDTDMSFYHPIKFELPVYHDYINKFTFADELIPLIQELESGEFEKTNFPLVYDTLALLYFNLICPPAPKELSGQEFYCYNPNSQRRYRHRILGPITLVLAGRKNVEPFFDVPPHVMGEYESNFGSRQQIAGNPNLLAILKTLYLSKTDKSLLTGITTTETFSRKGSKKKTIGKPGTLRRFGQVTNQLARVYDIYEAQPDAFFSFLPDEFGRWLES